MQLAQDADKRVVGRLDGEIIELFRAAVGANPPPSTYLEAGGAHQQRVQTLDGIVALGSCAGQRSNPAERLDVRGRIPPRWGGQLPPRFVA